MLSLLPKTVICGMLYVLCCIHIVQGNDIRFLHLNVENGLSQTSVFAIAQDYKGFIWIGTRDGLNKYDARKFTVYRNHAKDSTSLVYNNIRCIVEDSQRRLWIGTEDGLDLYNRAKDNFLHIPVATLQHSKNQNQSFEITQILEDQYQQIWIASSMGLYKIREHKEGYRAELILNTLQVHVNGKDEFFYNFRNICEDTMGKIWVCTNQGVVKLTQSGSGNHLKIEDVYATDKKLLKNGVFAQSITEVGPSEYWVAYRNGGIKVINEKKGTISFFRHRQEDKSTLPNDDVRSIKKDKQGRIWVGTFKGLALYRFGKFESFQSNDVNPYSLSDNSVRPIFQDKKGSIWIGTYFGGINIFDEDIYPFQNNTHSSVKNSLSFNVVSSFAEGNDKMLLVGTEGGGINFYDQRNKHFTRVLHDPKNDKSLSHNNVKSLCFDDQGNLWVGTYDGGLNLLKKGSSNFERFYHNPSDKRSLASNNVYSLLKDDNGDIWIGTYGGGLQVKRKNEPRILFETFNEQNSQLPAKSIRVLFKDSKGNLWIGSERGLYKKPKGSNRFVAYQHDPKKTYSLSGNVVISIHEDKRGRLWIGTYTTGLNMFDEKQNRFIRFDQDDGLPGNNIFGILGDKNGHLWISTNAGIAHFDPDSRRVRKFDNRDGLVGNEFSYNAAIKMSDGKFVFGGFSGFTIFHPDSVRVNRFEPPLAFTELRLFNKKSSPLKHGVVERDISSLKELTLNASQTVFSLEFGVLNYVHSDKNQYAYYLENFDEDWNYVDVPVATYTNLDPGTYKLWIKGSNNDQIWNNNPTYLLITILPPLWKTWWAYLIYIVVTGVAAYYIYCFFQGRNKLKQELLMEHLAFSKQQEIHEAKLRFFTNISHELRTPLSLIVGPIERLQESNEFSKKTRRLLDNAYESAHRLLQLVNQLLDFRKQESGHMQLSLQKTNLNQFLTDIKYVFQFLAEEKRIQFDFEDRTNTNLVIDLDREQLKKVLTNLLQNAFNITPMHGKVKMELTQEPSSDLSKYGYFIVSVWDTGCGISDEDIPFIFDAFYQIDKNSHKSLMGSGIGLALAKSLVHLHEGELTVESNLFKQHQIYNTVFRIKIPIRQDHLATELNEPTETLFAPSVDQDLIGSGDATESGKPSILVVEDNGKLRHFIKESLEDSFLVLEAADGEEAWTILCRHSMDLVLTDVMMPKCDGITLLNKIKGDKRTNHIPVLLLTARTADPHILEAYQDGAADYITKPFNVKLLLMKINNILSAHRRLEEKFIQEYLLKPNKEVNNEKSDFLNKVIGVIEDNLSNHNLSVQSLPDLIGINRQVLYRKIKDYSGLNLVEFINVIRLKKAAQILVANTDMNVSQVAYAVGFADPKYFSKSFKKVFKVSPSTYVQQRSTYPFDNNHDDNLNNL